LLNLSLSQEKNNAKTTAVKATPGKIFIVWVLRLNKKQIHLFPYAHKKN